MEQHARYQPEKTYETTYSWVVACGQKHVAYEEIYPGTIIHRRLPKTHGKSVHWKFLEKQRVELPPAFVASLVDARVWGDEGTVITTDGGLLADMVRAGHRQIVDHPIFQEQDFSAPVEVKGTALLLAARGSRRTYSHWLLDVLPRIHLFRSSSFGSHHIDYYILSGCNYAFQRETLHHFGVPLERIITLDKVDHMQVAHLIMPSKTYPISDIQPWTRGLLRQSFVDSVSFDAPERIFISRRWATHRHVRNEEEVQTFLARAGFVTVTLETMTVMEQARLFAGTKMIVAPHGSGLANLVFCDPGVKVIELFLPSAVNACFWGLADIVDAEYYYLLSKDPHPPEGADPFRIMDDMTIDVEELAEVIAQANITV